MDAKQKRLLIIVLFGVAAVGLALFLTNPALSPFLASQGPAILAPASLPAVNLAASPVLPGAPPTSTTPANANISGKTPILPQGAKVTGQVMRDIFAPPAELARLLPQQPRPGLPGGGPAISAGPVPALTGIIMGDSTRVAILRQGTISRSYRVGESAGAYRISSISARTATIVGPSGTVVLTMGQ